MKIYTHFDFRLSPSAQARSTACPVMSTESGGRGPMRPTPFASSESLSRALVLSPPARNVPQSLLPWVS
eukprot:363865-Chlamydomonas_euryale.AAC.22